MCGLCVFGRGGQKFISLLGHVAVQYHPYGDMFSLWEQNPSPHKQKKKKKMLEITCLAYPVQPTSLGASLHRVCLMVALAVWGHFVPTDSVQNG